MKNYCTLGDSRYLPQLICLVDSIKLNFVGNYKIHLLALDEKVYNFFTQKRKESCVIVHSLSQVLEDFEIKSTRYLKPGQEAISNAQASNKDPQFVQFCWSLAPCYSKWVMDRIQEDVTYVDADLFFLNDVSSFFKEIEDNSIGLVRHRIPYLYTSGEYNVGMVYFRNDGVGRSALKRWKDMLVNPNTSYTFGYGTCGDQKYLELIASLYREKLCIVDKKFGHLAPWNVMGHKYKDGKIIWENEIQDLVYFHFAHFVMEEAGSYRASYKNEWVWGDPLKADPFVKNLYDLYHRKMLAAVEEIK